ncbi:hypothetical protein FRUB_10605 [Fimbriiglobus ruber]|uniref:Uncharacterized protein n=1 Tax=Fimbriiglobus ruber TaxID=1908690 RepID=A0A225D4R8_9BACT|nr:hypothetical protein FRUB_10605 [Fimbriiglobus ruber]
MSSNRQSDDATDDGGGVVLGWVPEIPSNAITPYAWHPATMTLAIACGSDLRLYRIEQG